MSARDPRRRDGAAASCRRAAAACCAAAIVVILAAAEAVRATSNRHADPAPVSNEGHEIASAQPRGHDVAGRQRPERLRYRATWNAIPVANAELLVQPQPARGRAVSVLLRGRADTNEVLDLLWTMRDSFEATVGASPVTPRRFVLHQNENGRRRDTTIVADGSRLGATVERPPRRTRRADVPLAPRLHDPASVAYLIRTLPPELDERPLYHVLAGTKIYELAVAPAGSERVEVADRVWPARRFHLTLQLEPRDVESRDGEPRAVEPHAVESRGVESRDGESRIPEVGNVGPAVRDDDSDRTRWRELKVQEADLWISTGAERLPLRMTARTFWGWVTVELVARGGQPSA